MPVVRQACFELLSGGEGSGDAVPTTAAVSGRLAAPLQAMLSAEAWAYLQAEAEAPTPGTMERADWWTMLKHEQGELPPAACRQALLNLLAAVAPPATLEEAQADEALARRALGL
jgi:hypothetical protein